MKIVRNAIRCNLCGDEIESQSRHDMVWCKCGACAVDGGHDYLRRCYRSQECYTDISVVEKSTDEIAQNKKNVTDSRSQGRKNVTRGE